MGASSAGIQLVAEQIKRYYIFQKKLKSVLNNEQNKALFPKLKSNFQIQKAYIISYNWINSWKQAVNYNIAKDSFDKIIANDEKDLESQMEPILHNLMASNIIEDNFQMYFKDNKNAYKRITRKQILELEYFDSLIDEKTFKLLQKTGEAWYWPKGKEYKIDIIISKKIIILLIEKRYLAKFLYYGNMEYDNQLIQLTARCFDKANEGANSEKIYQSFVKFLLGADEDYFIDSLNNNNAGFVKNLFITLYEGYKIQFQNEYLALKYFEQDKKNKNLNFRNINIFRKIGLANIGATCYMNATLECFINVDPLTRYLLNEKIYYQIVNNPRIFELSSAYSDLLASICLDENISNYFEPHNFKEVISWKNPMFEGINANDSKDLINFMLEEMNQELSYLNINTNSKNMLFSPNSNSIDQTNQMLTFNKFKTEFTQSNNSIISQIFFFIIESKSQCQLCKTITYNYQSLFALEFPLESVYKKFSLNNYNVMNTNGIVIDLMHCFEHYREPTFFTGENRFFCSKCQRHTDNMNSNVLYSLPPYLIIILNRGKGKCFDCEVIFPEFLNLQNYVICQQSICNYQLNGVICHLGSSGMSGHFIAYCRNRINNNWYCFNDATITLCKDQKNDYKKGSPYILFYQSIDNKPNVLYNDNIPMNNNNFI